MSNEMTMTTENMSNEEVIQVLKGMVFGSFDRTTRKERQALDLAIKALKQQLECGCNTCEYYPMKDQRPQGEWKNGYVFALDKAFFKFDANCTYSGDRVLQILEKLKEDKGGEE